MVLYAFPVLYEVYQLYAGSRRLPNADVIAGGKLLGALIFERLSTGRYFAALTGPDGSYLVECLDSARRYDHPDGRVKIVGIQTSGRPKARYSHSDYQEWLCKPRPDLRHPPRQKKTTPARASGVKPGQGHLVETTAV